LKRLKTLKIRFGSVTVCSGEFSENKKGYWFGKAADRILFFPNFAKAQNDRGVSNSVFPGIMRSGENPSITLQ